MIKIRLNEGLDNMGWSGGYNNSRDLIALSDLKLEMINNNIQRHIPIPLTLLHYLIFVDDMTEVDYAPKLESTGIGFHLNSADAAYFCEHDYGNILNDNPTWCSPGITISCAWEGLFCMCTANFYSGTDCH